MGDYVIFTDSACDIPDATLGEWGVKSCSQTFAFDDSERQYTNGEMPVATFYQKMRAGGTAKTAAINADVLRTAFEAELQQGRDLLYLGFSSGLSATYNSGRVAAEELQAAYPARKILTVDTLSASAGFGLMVFLTVEKKRTGASIEEAARFAEDARGHLCHWFTVDDLVYLKRGGRISPTVAFVGGVLGVKPVLHMDDAGHLVNMFKARGRNASLRALCDQYGALATTPGAGTVFISHGDCPEDAEKLRAMLERTYGVTVALVTEIGPVIGAHSGPGTLALFFLGKER